MSLDVSPDGQTIVYDLLGDLYTLPITGGQATRITSGMALNRQPRYSPDGRFIAFVSDRSGSENVWLAEPDGRHAHQVSRLHGYDGYGAVTSPSWSPDGRTIIVSQKVGATLPEGAASAQNYRWLLAAYDLATGCMRWISDTTSDRARSALGPTFGRRGDVVYAAIDAFRVAPWGEKDWRIERVDVATGRIEPELGRNMGRAGMRPAIAPDGRSLVYASSSGTHIGLRIRDLQTDQEWWLVRDMLDDPPFKGAESRDLVPGYAFTPDAKAVIAAYEGKIHRINLATGRTAVIPFIVDVERGLGPLNVYQFALADTSLRTRSVMQPALSPDGNWVAFSALDRVWVMEVPQKGRSPSQPRRLTTDSIGEFYPSWAPDGRWIAYSTWRDGEGGEVRRTRVRLGSDLPPAPSERLTTDTALYFHTAVAPDGERVVAVRVPLPPERIISDKSQFDAAHALKPFLVWIPSKGGLPRTITSLASVHSPTLRYPVDQVYFRGDPTQIYVGLKSWGWTGKQTALTVVGRQRSGGEIDGEPTDVTGVISPNGRRALVTRKYTLFELSLPQEGMPGSGTVDLDRARVEPFGGEAGAAHRWGRALAPWVSWSRNGERVLFSQGGTLLVGEVSSENWTSFTPVDVPLKVPVDIPQGTLVLHGAQLVTMRGEEVIEQGDLVVQNNRIVAVGPTGSVAAPKNARVLDLRGATILPGYVDVHVHALWPKGVHAGQCWQCLAALAYGVTAERDPQATLDNDVFAYRERERSGDLLAPRVFSTGIPYHGTDPPIRTLADARDAVRPHSEYFNSETFKIYYDESTDRRARQLLALATAEVGLNATSHVNGLELGLASVIDGLSGVEHPSDVRIYDDVATLVALSGTIHTQTYGGLTVGALAYMTRHYGAPWDWAKMRRFVPPSIRPFTCINCKYGGNLELGNLLPLISGAAHIVAKHGRVGIGSHGNIPAIGYHYEMWLHALGGMPNHEILRSATIVGATAIGHAKDFGSLEPGKLADLQVLGKNPLLDIHNTTSIRYVMKNGRLYQAEDLTEIWPRHKPLPPMYLYDTTTASDYTRTTARPRATSDSAFRGVPAWGGRAGVQKPQVVY